ncbi:MAG: type III-A CRISPR-associated RAMP protein Csm5 [Paludibacteraceae bacterium]|nr:type III-A CRISPR-associated RAMP protein Csm5 [Paludibacteraceae bacterium]
MKKIVKIETLTSVHIGSGEVLQLGSDIVKGRMDNDYVLAVVSPEKVLSLIGEEHLQNWVVAIERKESTGNVVKRFAPNAKVEDYAKRIVCEWSVAQERDTLKEHIHNGQGKPYIPGSSIKGAIRTAILASFAENVNDAETKIDDSIKDKLTGELKKKKANANKVEKELFGRDPNNDVFRFLQVGDAYFGDSYTVALRMVNINERTSRGFWDVSKSQLIEALCPKDETEFEMKLNIEGYNKSKERCSTIGDLPMIMSSYENLFETINEHTISLLDFEIDYWRERSDMDDSDKVESYLEKIESIKKKVLKCCRGKECVLRIGHGSGWNFITGGWARDLDNFESLVVLVSRPNNQNYREYDFPKTRRVDDDCELLGFVKLSLQE